MPTPSEKAKHPALRQLSLSLLAKARGERVNDQSPGTLGAHQIYFPKGNLSIATMAPHTAMVGSSSAGKTHLQKGMLADVLEATPEEGGLRYRGLVYDPKRELYPFLVGVGIPEEQIIVTHPFDERSSAWDLAADFREPAQIEQLAEMIVPKKENSAGDNPFFDSVSRLILQDVIWALFASCDGDWDLRDIVLVCTDPFLLEEFLKKTERGRNIFETYLGTTDPRLAGNVRASLTVEVKKFRTLAMLWHNSPTKFSLEDWHLRSGLILMGADESRSVTMERINQLLFQRMSQLILGRVEEDPIDLTWIFLDEFREAGRLQGLRQLLTMGRSKGARVVLGFQDISGLHEVYGEHTAEEIVGLCANRIFLHLDNPRTRKWVSDFFAEREEIIESRSHNTNSEGDRSEGQSYQIGRIQNVLPVELHDLPLASPSIGVLGFCATPWSGKHYEDGRTKSDRAWFHVTPESIENLKSRSAREIACFVPRSRADQKDLPPGPADLVRWGLEERPNSSKDGAEAWLAMINP